MVHEDGVAAEDASDLRPNKGSVSREAEDHEEAWFCLKTVN